MTAAHAHALTVATSGRRHSTRRKLKRLVEAPRRGQKMRAHWTVDAARRARRAHVVNLDLRAAPAARRAPRRGRRVCQAGRLDRHAREQLPSNGNVKAT